MDEPVVNSSDSLTNLNCSLVHKIISSAILDKFIEQIEADERNSIAKSLDETASKEFFIGLLNSSFSDV
jgi:hypothetical protein